MTSDGSFFLRVLPLIKEAACTAKQRASEVISNAHLLWQVEVIEQNRLITEATRVENGVPLADGTVMTEDEFEMYLIGLAAWVPFLEEDLKA